MRVMKKMMSIAALVASFSVSYAQVEGQEVEWSQELGSCEFRMSERDTQEARRIIALIEAQKNKILEEIANVTNPSWIKKGRSFIGGILRQCAYLFGATMIGSGLVCVIWG